MTRTKGGIAEPQKEEFGGTYDELDALAKLYHIESVVFETANAKHIIIGRAGSPQIALPNAGNNHFDFLKLKPLLPLTTTRQQRLREDNVGHRN